MSKKKCLECVWSTKISEQLLFCMYPRCVVKKDNEIDQPNKEVEAKVESNSTAKTKKKRSKRNVSKKTKKAL